MKVNVVQDAVFFCKNMLLNYKYVLVFIISWLIFCAVADYVLYLGADSVRMVFGYVAAEASFAIANRLYPDANKGQK